MLGKRHWPHLGGQPPPTFHLLGVFDTLIITRFALVSCCPTSCGSRGSITRYVNKILIANEMCMFIDHALGNFVRYFATQRLSVKRNQRHLAIDNITYWRIECCYSVYSEAFSDWSNVKFSTERVGVWFACYVIRMSPGVCSLNVWRHA